MPAASRGVAQAQVINDFDTAMPDTNYWEWYDPVTEGGTATATGHYAISTGADPALGWINVEHVTDVVYEGDGAMRIDYSKSQSFPQYRAVPSLWLHW